MIKLFLQADEFCKARQLAERVLSVDPQNQEAAGVLA